MGANLWLLMTMYSSMRPVWDMSSMSQSRMGLPETSSRGLGKFSVKGYNRVAYPAAKIIQIIRIENCLFSRRGAENAEFYFTQKAQKAQKLLC